jgi:SAM-dependent methyltransferase
MSAPLHSTTTRAAEASVRRTGKDALLPCRFCGARLEHTFVDLGMSPLCESFLRPDELDQMERFYPLHVRVCERCFLVQLPEYVPPDEIFTEYAYFSSYSDSWVEHARRYADTAIERLGLTETSLVVETASNDGYLLQHFIARGVPVLGIEPARNVADAAIEQGIPTLVAFFDPETARSLAAEGKSADLLIGNNVLAQVPDLNGFVEAMKILLRPGGIVTVEFPHLMRLIEENQFDTIYHEHFSYFSFLTAREIFQERGLSVFDVDELPTHGGSLRLWACHSDRASARPTDRVRELAEREEAAGFRTLDAYSSFGARVEETKRALLAFVIAAKRDGKTIAGYGAPGKGNTLLNYCGIRTDFLDYTVDRNPYKHGLALPGTHVPVFPPGKIAETRPDYVLILPWNLKDEIIEQLSYVRDWGARFVIPIPEVQVLE